MKMSSASDSSRAPISLPIKKKQWMLQLLGILFLSIAVLFICLAMILQQQQNQAQQQRQRAHQEQEQPLLIHHNYNRQAFTSNAISSETAEQQLQEGEVKVAVWRPASPRRSSNESCEERQQQGHNTSLHNIVFGIAASARVWGTRKEYVKQWWRPSQMRGFVWMDRAVPPSSLSDTMLLPDQRVSADASSFPYSNKQGSRAGIRISRIVSETVRAQLSDAHWIVLGDDDTVFIPENLVTLLSKFDHRRYFYIGANSESHTQNIHFSYNMAYGGGGVAISYPLAVQLEKMQDSCIRKYPHLYGSDDRIQACMSELGVSLTKEPGFHQFDIYGDAFGLLAAHPVAPLVSLHHLDVILPIFPNMTRKQSLAHLSKAARLDPPGLLQQSICYDERRRWSVSVSWGFAVQVYQGFIPPRTLELPMRTFSNWYRNNDDIGLSFSSRPAPAKGSSCDEHAEVFYLESAEQYAYAQGGVTLSTYARMASPEKQQQKCKASSRKREYSRADLDWVKVIKEPAEESWHLERRRQCCRVMSTTRRSMEISVRDCEAGETVL